MWIIDKTGRKKSVSARDARILIALGQARPANEPEQKEQSKPKTKTTTEPDEKDLLIAELEALGITRDRRFGIETLRAELKEAKGYKTREMKPEE